MTARIPPLPCCFCGDTVLMLRGQDVVLDTVHLLDGPDDAEVLEKRLYGSAHLSCLSGTKWGTFWSARRFLNATCVGRARTLYEDAELSIAIQPVTEEIIISGGNGLYLWMTRPELARRVSTRGGWLVPIASQLFTDLTSRPHLARWIRREWTGQGHASLWTFIAEFGAEKHLICREAIRSGRIVPLSHEDVDPLEALERNFLQGKAEHHVLLANSAMKKVFAVVDF